MIFGKSRLELKVGIFVFIGLVILFIFVLLIGNFKTMTMGHRVDFMFNFVNGVKIGAPIRFAGVDIGEVKEINFIFSPQEQKTRVRIVGWIRRDVKIPADSEAWVNTLGLLGEKYLEIMPGKDYVKFVKVDQTMIGVDPIPMHEVVTLAKNIAANIDDNLTKIKNKEGTIGKLLYDPSIYNEIEKSIATLTKELETTIISIRTEFEGLLSDIKAHPWKLFFKGKEKK